MGRDLVGDTLQLSALPPSPPKDSTHKAIFPALPVPAPRPALLAVLLSRPAVVHAAIAAVSAVLRVAAFTPPVPSFAMADIASAGMVRLLWEVAPARTVAMFVVLRTEAWVEARRERKTSEM